jgi:hypothetical protein
MRYFVAENSVVRKTWGTSDTVLFIFAGASAEFALNKSVHWLYYTGKLPQAPLERLFSTVAYARKIIFSPYQQATSSIDSIAAIHKSVEQQRGESIPQWSYRDVLYMLIDYSIIVQELLEGKLTPSEKEEVFDVFYRLGSRMGITNLATSYTEWLGDRERHMLENLEWSFYTQDLYSQYKKHLGFTRYYLLRMVQGLICPKQVKMQLGLVSNPLFRLAIPTYRILRSLKLDGLIKALFLPNEYKAQIKRIDRPTVEFA